MRKNRAIYGPNVHHIILPPRPRANLRSPAPNYPPTSHHSQVSFLKNCPLAFPLPHFHFYGS